MVLEGMVPGKEDPTKQADEAMTLYAALARKGHPQALFGMGRVLFAQIAAAPETAEKRIPQVVELWQRAGKAGMPDAWYELGRLYQGNQYMERDPARMQGCFEQGARAGSSQSCYALGVLHGTLAEAKHKSNDTEAAHKAILLSNRYFLQAAQRGHAPSAYNMGLRYLLTQDPSSHASSEHLRESHKVRWGVVPDDRSAREWFAAASSKSTCANLIQTSCLR